MRVLVSEPRYSRWLAGPQSANVDAPGACGVVSNRGYIPADEAPAWRKTICLVNTLLPSDSTADKTPAVFALYHRPEATFDDWRRIYRRVSQRVALSIAMLEGIPSNEYVSRMAMIAEKGQGASQ